MDSKYYKDWIAYLKQHNLYGAWIFELTNLYSGVNYNSFIRRDRLIFPTDTYDKLISSIRWIIAAKRGHLVWLGRKYTNVKWGKVLSDYVGKESINLNKRRCKAKTKEKIYKEKVEQPWFNKSYERNNRYRI